MNFSFSSKVKDLQRRLQVFMDEHIYPNEQRYHGEIERNRWSPPAVIEELKPKARARAEIAMIKVVAPNVCLRVLDRAIQAHGGAGVSQDTFLAGAWANVRTLRLADGPDEVHTEAIAKLELRKWSVSQALGDKK
jgi:alkylation response protein AidB-like acyl-CoA dehydrogenase